MSDHQHAPDKFEPTDWSVKPVVITVVVLFAFLALGIVTGSVTEKLILMRLDRGEDEAQFHDTKALPPEPRLQVDEAADLKVFRDRENGVLTSYQWIDPAKTALRIPIDRAIDLVAAESDGGRR